MTDSAVASDFVQRPGFDPVRAAASSRSSALGAAVRQLKATGATRAHISDLVVLADAEKKELDRVFRHPDWCNYQRPGTRHNCGAGADYVIGVPRLAGDPTPSAVAEAWANEEDGAESVSVHLFADSEDDASGASGWFTPDAARALAAQLIAAADLLERRSSL
ncbi:hypothetical protein [Amycolatopsis sp. La24]|uniref:hypothetical protein n=1 Tax=Amycolatopsis sp. La24 TaxID=3028304 RepID=UPI0023AFD056|nr:hypothetical protein [Amycolatopsis sp. La24]